MNYIDYAIKALRALIQKVKDQKDTIFSLREENENLSNTIADLKAQCDQYRSKVLDQEEKITQLTKQAHSTHGYPFNV